MSSGPTKYAIHKWVNTGDLLIAFSTSGVVPIDVWQDFIKHLETAPIRRFLGTSVGTFEVSSVQRKQMSEIMSRRRIPIASVTDDKFVRGIITAASWLGVDIKPFSWADLRQAIRHLGVTQPMEDVVYKKVMDLRADCVKQGVR